MSEKQSVLVFWIKDKKVGVENIDHVPEEDRVKGTISQVKWSGDNQRYPARILEISDNSSVLEKAETEFTDLLDVSNSNTAMTRKRDQRKAPGVASDNQVAAAIGLKQQVPQNLQAVNKRLAGSRRNSNKSQKAGQVQLDQKALAVTKALAFDKEDTSLKQITNTTKSASQRAELEYSCGESGDEDNLVYQSNDVEAEKCDEPVSDKVLVDVLITCSCGVCKELKKHMSESTRMFLKSISTVYLIDESLKIQYLDLLPIPAGVPVVELTKRKGIYIPLADKNQIKIDCKNQPSRIVKETLHTLYGREAFRQAHMTARGNRSGTYGFRPNVLVALLGFVNRNVDEKKRLTQADLVNLINKRVSDWRKEADKSEVQPVKKPPSVTVSRPPPSESLELPQEHSVVRSDGDQPLSAMLDSEEISVQEALSLIPTMSSHTPLKITSTVTTYSFSPAKSLTAFSLAKTTPASPAKATAIFSPAKTTAIFSPAKTAHHLPASSIKDKFRSHPYMPSRQSIDNSVPPNHERGFSSEPFSSHQQHFYPSLQYQCPSQYPQHLPPHQYFYPPYQHPHPPQHPSSSQQYPYAAKNYPPQPQPPYPPHYCYPSQPQSPYPMEHPTPYPRPTMHHSLTSQEAA